MRHLFVVFGKHFVLGNCRLAPRAPWHGVPPLVNPPFFKTDFEEVPDHIVIFIAHRVVGTVPVHKVTQALTLLCLDCAKLPHPGFTELDKFCYRSFFVSRHKVFNILFCTDPEFLFDFHFYPKTLTVKAVLKTLSVPPHGPEALPKVFVCAAPRVVDSHGVVSGNRAIEE